MPGLRLSLRPPLAPRPSREDQHRPAHKHPVLIGLVFSAYLLFLRVSASKGTASTFDCSLYIPRAIRLGNRFSARSAPTSGGPAPRAHKHPFSLFVVSLRTFFSLCLCGKGTATSRRTLYIRSALSCSKIRWSRECFPLGMQHRTRLGLVALAPRV